MASVGHIELIPCPGCGERVIPPPPDSLRAWQCPFCERRFHRKLLSSDSSVTIPAVGLFSKNPWPPDVCLAERERTLWHPARWPSHAMTVYAALLVALMVAYHIVMTLLATLWLALRSPLLMWEVLNDEAEPENDGPRTPAWLEPVRTWLPHFRQSNRDLGIGPALVRDDAPGIFVIVAEVAKKLGSPEPDEIRVTHLPCCGVLEQRGWGGLQPKRRVLVIGLPLLYVLSIEELRSVIAHELAHLSRGDATLAFIVSQFVDSLEQSIAAGSRGVAAWINPCAIFARLIRWVFRLFSSPLSRHQEHRADRLGALVSGSDVLVAALRNVALVQPVFREVLCYYHPTVVQEANLYKFFRNAWLAMNEDLKHEMQDALVAEEGSELLGPYPTLRARIARLDRYPKHREPDGRPARRLLANRTAIEATLQNQLYRTRATPLSVFRPTIRWVS